MKHWVCPVAIRKSISVGASNVGCCRLCQRKSESCSSETSEMSWFQTKLHSLVVTLPNGGQIDSGLCFIHFPGGNRMKSHSVSVSDAH